MENQLRIIRHLYDEDERPEEVEQVLAEDEALRAEFRSMRAVKQHLDHRAPQHADADVIARITDAAAEAASEAPAGASSASTASPRSDRPPVARTAHRQRRIGVAAAAFVVLLAVGVAFWQLPLGGESGSANLAQESVSGPSMTASSAQKAAAQDVPAWDEGDDVARLHQYIQSVQARSSTQQWDASQLPLRPASR